MLAAFRKRLAAARAADPLETEQIQIRVVNGAIIAFYYLVACAWDGVFDSAERLFAVCFASYHAIGLGVFGWAMWRPGVNVPRRWTGAVIDIAGLSLGMILLEEIGAALYAMYLWVILGNGFRYGRRYLHGAQALAAGVFTIALLLSSYWQRNLMLGFGLLAGLIAVPLYVAKLLARLEEARAEAIAANAGKTKFLAAASHDLRQPMQALALYASVIAERRSEAPAERVVQGVQISVKTLERLFDSLLDISKIESGVIKPSPGAFALQALIEQVVEAERPLAAQKGLELRAVRTSAWVESDPALLERMLKNLVTNAVRYPEQGGIVVGCRRAGAGRVRLEVADTGIGIAPEEQRRIFDEYYQIDGGSGQGLGLGLPIVKSLGELLGHAVAVRSAPGRGSVFSVELPLTAALSSPTPPLTAPFAGAAGRVALVDDDVEIRRSMQLILEGWGYELVSGASAVDVETALNERGVRPDALIVDYRLAGSTTGAQVVERFRASFGEQLPALIITGNANVAAVRERAPGLPIAVKPVAPGKLRAFLAEAIAAA